MSKRYETENWPFMKARWFKKVTGRRKVRIVTIHCMQNQEKGDSAESCGHWFQITDSPASAHTGVDSNSVVQYVRDNDVAFAAPGVNHDGIHIELAGVAEQTPEQWRDPYSALMLDRAADVCAQYCLKYDIPIRHLTLKELRGGKKGIIGHWDATRVYKPNRGHTDPGTGFPWNFFLDRVKFHYDRRK